MSPLVVEVDGRVLRLEGKQVYRIGRAIEADVVLTAGSVSRQHAELRAAGTGWVIVDTGSNFGTFVDGQSITTARPITGRTAVRCGPPAAGAELVVIPAEEYDENDVTPVVPPAHVHAPAPAPAPAPVADRFAPPVGRPVAPPSIPFAPAAAAPPPDARPAGAPGLPQVVAGNDATQVLAATPAAPPGWPAAAQARTGPDLLLIAEGREHRFRHPAQLTVGRRGDCTVVLSDPAASRVHAHIQAVPGGWYFTNASNEGTYRDGRRIGSLTFDERVSLRLGHPVAGPELTLVPILSAAEEEKRASVRRWKRRLLWLGAVAAVLLLVGGTLLGAWLLSGGDDDTKAGGDGGGDSLAVLDGDELEAAKAATVKISATTHLLDDPSNEGEYHGSGSIIRKDGLILTNAHVAEPEADGLEEKYGDQEQIANPEYLLISLTDGMTDTNEAPAYRARVVEADGHLDAAVIQIYADEDGKEIDPEDLDLPVVPIGDSGSLRAGDPVTVLGFPGIAGEGKSISVSGGLVSTVLDDPELGEKSELDTDARIAPGNSGGMAINNDGQLIGIPTSLYGDAGGSTVVSGRIRSIDAVKDLIEKAEDETD